MNEPHWIFALYLIGVAILIAWARPPRKPKRRGVWVVDANAVNLDDLMQALAGSGVIVRVSDMSALRFVPGEL